MDLCSSFSLDMPTIATGTQLLDAVKILEHAPVRQGMKVADFGCGALGHFVIPAAHAVGKDGRVYAVDIQKGMLTALDSRLKMDGMTNVELVWGDIERLRGTRMADGALDLVLLVNNLFLAADKALAGREAYRTLTSGGKLLVVDWKVTGAPLGPPVHQRVPKDQATLAMQTAGFHKLDDFEAGPYHYGIIFQK